MFNRDQTRLRKPAPLRRLILPILGLLAGIAAPITPALAQASVRDGYATSMFISSAANFAVRVQMSKDGINQLSDCPGFFAFLNKSHDNYDVYVAGLLTSYAQNKRITLYVSKNAGGYCQISEFSFSG